MHRIVSVWIAMVMISFHISLRGQDIVVKGGWSLTVDESNLAGGAGTDLIDTYESDLEALEIRIRKGGLTKFDDWYWRVDVNKSDFNWHQDFRLDVRRTSDGTGEGNISGGSAYREVTDSPDTFFSGSRNRSQIGVQLRLRGMSVSVPPDDYSTTVYYTVIEM